MLADGTTQMAKPRLNARLLVFLPDQANPEVSHVLPITNVVSHSTSFSVSGQAQKNLGVHNPQRA